jgi:hypothetical protein
MLIEKNLLEPQNPFVTLWTCIIVVLCGLVGGRVLSFTAVVPAIKSDNKFKRRFLIFERPTDEGQVDN